MHLRRLCHRKVEQTKQSTVSTNTSLLPYMLLDDDSMRPLSVEQKATYVEDFGAALCKSNVG